MFSKMCSLPPKKLLLLWPWDKRAICGLERGKVGTDLESSSDFLRNNAPHRPLVFLFAPTSFAVYILWRAAAAMMNTAVRANVPFCDTHHIVDEIKFPLSFLPLAACPIHHGMAINVTHDTSQRAIKLHQSIVLRTISISLWKSDASCRLAVWWNWKWTVEETNKPILGVTVKENFETASAIWIYNRLLLYEESSLNSGFVQSPVFACSCIYIRVGSLRRWNQIARVAQNIDSSKSRSSIWWDYAHPEHI